MNVLMAWELGSGLGHTVVLHSVGQELTNRGHQVSYALREPETAKTLNFLSGSHIYQAPIMGVAVADLPAAYDYADLLLIRAYENTDLLKSRLDAWLRIFDQTRPHQVIADHAPAARLAAHIADIPSLAIGNGFAVPPWTSPLHPFRDARGNHLDQQASLERRLDEAMNSILNLYGKSPVERTIDIFIGGSRCITTFSELDNYADRAGDDFCGPIMQIRDGKAPAWQSDYAKRVFVYLYPDAPLLPVVLSVLGDMDASVLVYTGGEVEEHLVQAARENTVFSEKPLDMSKLGESGCDGVICQGGNNTVASALLQGCRVVTYPRHVDQNMISRHLEAAGLCRTIRADNQGKLSPDTVRETIEGLFEDEAMERATKMFAQKYKDYQPNQGAATIADTVERVAGL